MSSDKPARCEEGTALPSDVRWQLCPTVRIALVLRAMPLRLGVALLRGRLAEVVDLPHIRRQGRTAYRASRSQAA